MAKREEEKQELKQFKKDVSKEVKNLRKETASLKESNQKYRKTMKALQVYFENVGSGDDLIEAQYDSSDLKTASASFIS